MKSYKPGDYAVLAELVRQRREAQHTPTNVAQLYAMALRTMATGLEQSVKSLQEIPGSYPVWCKLLDAAEEAKTLAQQWEARGKMTLFDVVSQDVSLRIRGKEAWGLCPFHQEKTPSFSVNIDIDVYYCFGCHSSGDAITYLRRKRGLTFREAEAIILGESRWAPPRQTRETAALERARTAFLTWEQAHHDAMMAQYKATVKYRMELEELVGILLRPESSPTLDDLITRWHAEYTRLALDEHLYLGALDWWASPATQAERVARWDREQRQKA